MAATAQSRQTFINGSHRKLRRVANEIRGKSAYEAVNMLRFMPYTAAVVMLKNLKAAIANAGQKYGDQVGVHQLVVSQVMVDEGPATNRFKPRAQGRIYKIQKPTAHVFVEVEVKGS